MVDITRGFVSNDAEELNYESEYMRNVYIGRFYIIRAGLLGLTFYARKKKVHILRWVLY